MVFYDPKVDFCVWSDARCADDRLPIFDPHFEFLLVDSSRRKEGSLSPCPEPIR